MKTIQVPLACITLFFAGCMNVSSPYAEQLGPVAERYSSVKSGALREEIEEQLGKPSREEEDGSSVWETRFDGLNYAMVKVSFDRQNKATKVEVVRAHGKTAPGYQAITVSSRTK